jgi:hypothetical protein
MYLCIFCCMLYHTLLLSPNGQLRSYSSCRLNMVAMTVICNRGVDGRDSFQGLSANAIFKSFHILPKPARLVRKPVSLSSPVEDALYNAYWPSSLVKRPPIHGKISNVR